MKKQDIIEWTYLISFSILFVLLLLIVWDTNNFVFYIRIGITVLASMAGITILTKAIK